MGKRRTIAQFAPPQQAVTPTASTVQLPQLIFEQPDMSASARLNQIMGVLDQAAAYGKVVAAEDQRVSVAQRGHGRDVGNSDESFFTGVFDAGPTKETIGMFPPPGTPISTDGGPSEELSLWANTTAMRRVQELGLTPDQAEGYIGEVSPKLMALGVGYINDRDAAEDALLINAFASELGSSKSPSSIDELLLAATNSLHSVLSPGELEDKVIMPALRTAMLRGDFARAEELLPMVIASDPVEAAEQHAKFAAAILPEYQTILSQSIGTIFDEAFYSAVDLGGDPSTLNTLKGVYEASGGSGNAAAVKATVDAVNSYIRSPNGRVIEGRIHHIEMIQSLMSETGDPLHLALQGAGTAASNMLISQRSHEVEELRQQNAQQSSVVTELMYSVLHGQSEMTQAELFDHIRTNYPGVSEGYIEDYLALQDKPYRGNSEPGSLISLENQIATDWNPGMAIATRGAIADAFRDGDITASDYTRLNNKILTSSYEKMARENVDLLRYKSDLKVQFAVAAGMRYSRVGANVIELEMSGLADGVDRSVLASRMRQLTILQSDFEREWVTWNRDGAKGANGRETIEDPVKYQAESVKKLDELYNTYSSLAVRLGDFGDSGWHPPMMLPDRGNE